MMSDVDFIEYNRRIVEEFRANGGQVQGWAPFILLTTKGAKTCQTRIYPLMSVPYGDTYLAVASKGGAPQNPLWYYNVLAHPDVMVEVGNETFEATTRSLTGAEREQAFQQAVAVFSNYAELPKKTAREILFFCLNGRQKQTRTRQKNTRILANGENPGAIEVSSHFIVLEGAWCPNAISIRGSLVASEA